MDNLMHDLYMKKIDEMPELSWNVRFGSEGFDSSQSYIIKGLLPSNSLSCIYGPSGSFKSFLALSWCCHIATGTTWDGRSVDEGSVLYIAGEGGIGVSRRIKAWEEQYSKSTAKTLARVDSPIFPADTLQVKELIQLCQQIEDETGKPLKIIVFDTLARCYGGNDENSSKDMGAFIKGCDQIKQKTGATVLVVHHTGKNTDNGARGSSALRAALDVEILVQRESNLSVVVQCTKMKDAEHPAGTAFALQSVYLMKDAENDPVTSLALIDQGRKPIEVQAKPKPLSSNHQAVLLAVKNSIETGEVVTYDSIRDILNDQGLVTKHYSRWIKDLKVRGIISLADNKTISIIKDEPEA